MTLDERVRALEPLGFSERQTRFLVTVALHGGFCLRRHYMAFAGLKYGAGVRHFLDRLVSNKLARRFAFRADRGHVYHLHHAAVFEAIGQRDNRNRRRTSPALIARKLMLLDYVLTQPAGDWYATEEDKVVLFTTQFDVSFAHLPQRVYLGKNRDQPRTTRYFIHKAPIQLVGDPPTVSFVCLVTDTTGAAVEQFLQDHLRLLNHLPRWRVVAVVSPHILGGSACRSAFVRFCRALDEPRPAAEIADLRVYFTRRQAVEREDFSFMNPNVQAVGAEWRAARARFAAAEFEDLYRRWKDEGPAILEQRGGEAFLAAVREGCGELVVQPLPIRYDRFGTRPGVS
jgi:hypothetical protein